MITGIGVVGTAAAVGIGALLFSKAKDVVGEKIADLFVHLGDMIYQALRSLFYFIISSAFKLCAYLYNMFTALCHGRLLDDSTLNVVATRVGAILGLVMLFYVLISFIQMLVNPDTITAEDKGAVGVVKRVIITIAMLGLAPFAFSTLYEIQSSIVDSNAITKIVFPVEVKTENFGRVLTSELFLSGFRVDDVFFDSNGNVSLHGEDGNPITAAVDLVEGQIILACQQQTYMLKDMIYSENEYDAGKECLNAVLPVVESDSNGNTAVVNKYVIDFNWLVLLGTAIFLVYYLFSYCIGVGMRMIQLAVLEIISPMAIISYISPKKENMFSKWTGLYFATYIDVFIRIAVINFVVFLIATILDTDSGVGHFWNTISVNQKSFDGRFIKIVMIIALLSFAKKAPELIKELFPGSASHLGLGGFHFKDMIGGNFSKNVLAAGASLATVGTAGAVVNGVGSAVGRFQDFRRLRSDKGITSALFAGLGGFGSAALSSYKSSLGKGNPLGKIQKGISNSRTLDNQYRELIAKGGSRTGQILSSAADLVGSARGTRDDFKIESAKKVENPLKEIFDLAENTVAYKDLMQQKQSAYNRNDLDEAKLLQMRADAFRNSFVEASLRGSIADADDLTYQVDMGTDAAGNPIMVDYSAGISGGDKVKGNTIRTKYTTAKVEIDQLKPYVYDANGQIDKSKSFAPDGIFVLGDAESVSAADLNAILKTAQNTQANVAGTPGFRAGQANKPAGSKSKNHS